MQSFKSFGFLLAVMNSVLLFVLIFSLAFPSRLLATEGTGKIPTNSEISQNQPSPDPRQFNYQAFVTSIKGKSGEEITDFLNQYSDWELVGFDNELFPEENQAIFIFKKPR